MHVLMTRSTPVRVLADSDAREAEKSRAPRDQQRVQQQQQSSDLVISGKRFRQQEKQSSSSLSGDKSQAGKVRYIE